MKTYDPWRKAQDLIAQGALTNSKNPRSHVYGVYPTHMKDAHGVTLTDTQGKRYIDYICGLGTNIIGYGNTRIAAALAEQAGHGVSPSFPTTLELDCAEALKTIFPRMKKFKFVKTGTEACMAAIKMARAYTGRMQVLSEAYHGWSDPFVSLTPPAAGVPPHPDMVALTDISQVTEDTAAVIIEPIITDWSDQRLEWLQMLQIRCKEVGAMLIFDEIITGFRFLKWSVHQAFNLDPDIVCVGKAIANGMPLACVMSPNKALMDNPQYFVSGTYAGECMSLRAAIETMKILKTDTTYGHEAVWNLGKDFLERFNAISPKTLTIQGYPTRGVFKAKDELTLALFFQEMCRSGVLFCRSWFFNAMLAGYTDEVINLARGVLTKIQTGSVQLKGELPQSPFSMKVRKDG